MDTFDDLRLWPNQPLPEIEYEVQLGRWECLEDCEWILRWVPGDIGRRFVALPSDFWLRDLLKLDLQDGTALAALFTEYGMLDLLTLGVGTKRGSTDSVRVEDARLALARVRNIARLVLAHGGAPQQWESAQEVDEQTAIGVTGYRRWALSRLNKALIPVHPRVDQAGRKSNLDAGLLNALAVQMFNFLLERPHMAECQRCGAPFPAKYGGSETRKHIYCSPDCKNAAIQKRYRDRKRKEVKINDQTSKR